MRLLYIDGVRKFIFAKPKEFCERKNIIINYAGPNIYKDNGLTK